MGARKLEKMVLDALTALNLNSEQEVSIGPGVLADFIVSLPNDGIALVEVDAGREDEYLPFSSYGKLLVYEKALLKSPKTTRSTPRKVIVTNQKLAEHLKTLMHQSEIQVVITSEKDDSDACKGQLREDLRRALALQNGHN